MFLCSWVPLHMDCLLPGLDYSHCIYAFCEETKIWNVWQNWMIHLGELIIRFVSESFCPWSVSCLSLIYLFSECQQFPAKRYWWHLWCWEMIWWISQATCDIFIKNKLQMLFKFLTFWVIYLESSPGVILCLTYSSIRFSLIISLGTNIDVRSNSVHFITYKQKCQWLSFMWTRSTCNNFWIWITDIKNKMKTPEASWAWW